MVLSSPVSSRLFPGFFPNFLEWRDQKKVVSSRYCQFGKWGPVSSCLVSIKTSSGTQTSCKYHSPFFCFASQTQNQKRFLSFFMRNNFLATAWRFLLQCVKLKLIRKENIALLFFVLVESKYRIQVSIKLDFSYLPHPLPSFSKL